ncbi:MAG: FKBP-type peptidyl-prolyl cis-trans isomerase [Chitinophagaceae bacterium]
MKKVYYSLVMIATLAMAASCNNVSYQKAKSGMLYKIISSNSKDSTAKEGNWLKLHFTQKLNDSVMQTSYGKMPVYAPVASNPNNLYNPAEIFHLLKKGDSVVTVVITDSLLKRGIMPELPPFMKKGDRITTAFRVIEVFQNDSLYQADATIEQEKDRPRQMKEQEEQMAKMKKDMREQKQKDELEMENSGEAAKGVQEMEAFLKSKNISAQKTGKGTFVVIQQQGTGPQADSGKYVTVKYNGRILATDSVFQSNSYTFPLGQGEVIAGWDEGLKLFKEGGKGILYIPGFRAYGKNPPQGSPFKAYEPLKFDVEMVKVSDTMPAQPAETMPQRRN